MLQSDEIGECIQNLFEVYFTDYFRLTTIISLLVIMYQIRLVDTLYQNYQSIDIIKIILIILHNLLLDYFILFT
jgi:hypothetical protein